MEPNPEKDLKNIISDEKLQVAPSGPEPEKLVYLVTTDSIFGSYLAQGIGHFGYQVHLINDLKGLEHTTTENLSMAVLIDIPDEEESTVDFINKINLIPKASIPLMFISEKDDQEVRLQAIRAGGVAFFKKPVELVELIDKLDEIKRAMESIPYRVLIIDDQPTVASYYQMVLKMAGMTSQVIVNSQEVLKTIQEFRPDLILMDLYMPDISGIELATVIRQINEFMSIPIVFLSSEDDFTKQMEAMNLGGDDFLTKPIKAVHLVALVKSRLERLRILRSFMIRDSLTGLLNHTSFLERLNQQVQYCIRKKTGFAIAMFDLDRFKQVNDLYGHLTGDAVLKSLSRLLKQRLRKSDIIGRYGGEEFVTLFPDQEAATAFRIMDEIRKHFAEMQHLAPNQDTFTITFSCGIATFPKFSTPSLLVDAADQALYAAKAAGRNCVKVAR